MEKLFEVKDWIFDSPEKAINGFTSQRTSLVVLGFFLWSLAYATYYNENLNNLPTRGPLVVTALVGGFTAVIGAFITDTKNSDSARRLSFAILISYSLIRAINFGARAFEESDSFWDTLAHLNPTAIWLFIAYLACVKYTLRGKVNK